MHPFRSVFSLITGIFVFLAACGGSEGNEGHSGPSSLDRIYTITPVELRREPRSYAFEQAVLLEFSSDFPEIRLFEWTRAQNPRSYQAEQRGFFYSYLRGFREMPAAGPVPIPEQPAYGDVRNPIDSEHLRGFGDPRSGWRLEVRGMGLEMGAFGRDYEVQASPMGLLRTEEKGLAEYRVYTGAAVRQDRGERHGALLWFESMYLPAVNPFESLEVGAALTGGHTQFWLYVPKVRSVLFLDIGENDVLAPLVALNTGVRLEVSDEGGRVRQLEALSLDVSDRRGDERGERWPAAWEGSIASDGECKTTLEEIHGTSFYSLARGRSRLASLRGRIECEGESFRVTGFARSWPEP